MRTERACGERTNHDPIARLKLPHSGPDADDAPAAFIAEICRLSRAQRIDAEHLHQVAKIQSRRGDFDFYFSCTRRASGASAKLKGVDTARLADLQSERRRFRLRG